MTTWWTTDQVVEHLRLSLDLLADLRRAPVREPAWVLLAGRPGQRSARYRWDADRVDSWFREACEWRASRKFEDDGSFAGETEGGEPESTGRPATPDEPRKRSRRRSTSRSRSSEGTNLVALADRLLSR